MLRMSIWKVVFQDGGVINTLIVKAISKNVSVYTHSPILTITGLLWCCGFQSVSEGKSEDGIL